MIKTFRLDTKDQSIVLASCRERLPSVIYHGPLLPAGENLETLYHAQLIDLTGGMLDENPEISICPEASRTFPGHPGLIITDNEGNNLRPAFRFDSEESSLGSLTLKYTDKKLGLSYVAKFIAHAESNVIETCAGLESLEPIRLHWFAAPVMPGPQSADEMIDFAGRWCGEFQEVRTPWQAGLRCRENRTGRTGHEHFPGLIIPERGTLNTKGKACGFHYGWSGGHKMIAEELPDGRRQIQFGHAPFMENAPAKNFETAPLFTTFSESGLNGVAVAFQRHLRLKVVKHPDPLRPRPVHYNCWEAIYFKHNLPELKEIAAKAAELGAERFVLDDGWFGTRDDDTRALSEWEVDRRKYPDGLKPLIDHVRQLGMTFGIWFEPEMINPESSVYKQNPHWALGPEDQILGRHQMALNMALPEVRDFLYEKISAILNEYDIDYIKWDHNRVLPLSDAAQTRGTYELFDRLNSAFPNVEIESCSSGGGRIDFGILKRTGRVWLSDSNDATERVKIQHGAALFLPANITGSHVGPRKCHTSGRVLSMSYRAWVAAQRHMGFEMDPRELTDEEADILKKVTARWKQERDWLMKADILRLDTDDKSVFAEQHLAEDGNKFIIFANKIDTSTQISPRPLKATRLDPAAFYEVDVLNREDIHSLSRGNPLLKTGSARVSGIWLMNNGLNLPWSFPESIWVIKGVKQL